MAMQVEIIEVTTQARMEDAWAIRRLVFIEEQRVPEAIELDADDARAIHALALEDGKPVGCGRIVAEGDHVKIGRMAVLREKRGLGIGRRILEFLMDAARREGFGKAILHAQLTAEGFYLRSGFLPLGAPFEEAGIMHREMARTL